MSTAFNPHISPSRLLQSETFLLSIRYDSIHTLSTLHTALDAPSLVFFSPAGTCFLNHSYGYAFGRRHPRAKKILRDLRITW